MNQQPQVTAAKVQLVERRAAIARSHVKKDSDATLLGQERPGEDLSQSNELASVLVLLSARERAELADVDAALLRIEAGTWGVCEACDSPIAEKRLKIVPQARTCADCGAALPAKAR
jgi:RNA polymerase-binding transcription factor DksA